MNISAALVKELRDRTNAGFMECKKALVEASGNIEAAIEILQKSGQAKAVKSGTRIAAEGTIVVLPSSDNKSAVMLEANCETDFVAREERFQNFAKTAASLALKEGIEDITALQEKTESDRLELVRTLGENITLRRLALMSTNSGVIGVYGHGDANGVRIGSMVLLKTGTVALAKDLAMHIAAMKPEYLKTSDLAPERIEKEKEIFIEQVRQEGKPEAMFEKIVAGKMKKFAAEISLLGQNFVKDSDKTVEALLQAENAEIEAFVRFEVGEGIEKKQDNFAEEVMAQVRGT